MVGALLLWPYRLHGCNIREPSWSGFCMGESSALCRESGWPVAFLVQRFHRLVVRMQFLAFHACLRGVTPVHQRVDALQPGQEGIGFLSMIVIVGPVFSSTWCLDWFCSITVMLRSFVLVFVVQ